MSWYWWIVVAIGIGFSLIRIVAILGSIFKDPASALDEAMELIRRGDCAAAEKKLTAALKNLPPADVCVGREAVMRFNLLLQLSTSIRKGTRDKARELEILNECIRLAPLQPSPPKSDRINPIYQAYMNHAVAASKMGRHSLEEESLVAALQAARTSETKCKCLAYRIWAILKQKDLSRSILTQNLINQFDSLANHHNVSPVIVFQVEIARVILCLCHDDLNGARIACLKAGRMNPADRMPDELSQLLLHADASAEEALGIFFKHATGKAKPGAIMQSLSPLPEWILSNRGAMAVDSFSGESVIPDLEIRHLGRELQILDRSGDYAEIETRLRQVLVRHTRQDKQRTFFLENLGRTLMRRMKLDEALTVSGEAIWLAHQCNEARFLALVLNLRAEILCGMQNFPEALRTLELNERYLHEGQVRDLFMQAWTAHTRGMAYRGCGWWEAGASNLRHAIQLWEHLRDWRQRAGVIGEFATLVLAQSQAEGPDPALLEEAIRHLDSAYRDFELVNHTYELVLAKVHALTIRCILSTLRKDKQAIKQVEQGFGIIEAEYGPRDGHPGFFNDTNLLYWTIGHCRAVRAGVDLQMVGYEEGKAELDALLRLLERAINQGPLVRELWHEKTALHLCRARNNVDPPQAAVMASAACVEVVMDILRSESGKYTDPQVRAGWLGSANDILETLASIAALDPVQRNSSPLIAARMVSLIQYLRSRSRQDLIRNVVKSHQTPAELAKSDGILRRIHSLNHWLDRLDAIGWSDRNDPSRGLGAKGVEKKAETTVGEIDFLESLLSVVTEKILQEYPEYSLFVKRSNVEDELQKREQEFAQSVSGNTFLRMQANQLESDAPFDLSELQSNLSDGEVVLDYYVGPYSLHAGVIARNSLKVIPLSVSDMHEFRLVTKHRLIPPKEQDKFSLAASMRQCSGWLFPKRLVQALTELGCQRLYVVASGSLWNVPFHWLDADGQLVLERWETCITPSARFAGKGQGVTASSHAFAVGYPGKSPYLEQVGPEVKEVAKLLSCPVLFEAEATPQEVLQSVLPKADIIHFACHGICDPVSPLMSCILLEPDNQHPDGRLMLHEITAIPLRATVISLGACYTARYEGPVTFPESLALAFIGAGAQFVIASLWQAYDDECLSFALDFYSRLKEGKEGQDPVNAFHQTQLSQAKRLRSDFDRHDYRFFTNTDFTRLSNFVLLSVRKG